MTRTELLKVAKPIIFNTPMVQALLDGRKSQTRRIVKPQPSSGIRKSVFVKSGLEDGHGREIKPRYQPSDILWVRETWSKNGEAYLYKAGYPHLQGNMWIKWRPSIFMPREATRIFLEVTANKIERVQDITEEDAQAEGVNWNNGKNVGWEEKMKRSAIDRFKELWDSLNAKRGYGWETNPWVWVYEFKRVEESK